ncbi:hypothetical protein [Sphingomonas profundi]|uniref:hypothetical protein n=1 Tax=Alterirhizorhabdus profundi TaxID=2681549 RepID=UPI0012E95DD7|nr:hypothetical protein [Sphingomonas profundi]
MSPGTYLRLRREATGLSLRELAYQFFTPPLDLAEVEQLLVNAEADDAPLDAGSLHRVNLFVPLDIEIYASLLAELPTRSVCRRCACSWFDPCQDSFGPCAWADAAATLCTRCARIEATAEKQKRPVA